jgi:ATP phosphoribosyltransferase
VGKMHKEKILRFGLPTGSLNHPERWNTKALLDSAGLPTVGYEPGNRKYYPRFTHYRGRGDVSLEAVAVRPQNVPYELCRNDPNGLDLAITGSDWASEGEAAGHYTQLLCNLDYGHVDIVADVHNSLPVDSISDLIRLKSREKKRRGNP